ncbi:MAG: cbb3-type cytochrome c oxidase subunit 3 [Sphingobium sp.]
MTPTMTYDAIRHAADSWGLLFLTLVFLTAVWCAFRPSARTRQQDAKMIPLRDEEPGHD